MTERPPPASTGRLPTLDMDALDADQRAVLDLVAGGRGRLPTPYRLWVHSPELARQLYPLGRFLSQQTSLAKPEIEIAVLTAAHHWHARYVFAAHAREAREAGLDPAIIAAIGGGRAAEPADRRQRTVAAMMTALTAPEAVPQAMFDEAVDALGHGAIAELIVLAGYFTAVGLAMKMYAVEPSAA